MRREKILDFKPIQTTFYNKDKHPVVDDNIGTFDLESYFNPDTDTSKAYAVGFHTNLSPYSTIYYMNHEVKQWALRCNKTSEERLVPKAHKYDKEKETFFLKTVKVLDTS